MFLNLGGLLNNSIALSFRSVVNLDYALKNQPEPHALTKSLAAHEKGAARALVTREVSNHIYSGGSDGKIIQWNYSNNGWIANEIVPERSKTEIPYQIYSMDVSPDALPPLTTTTKRKR